MSSFKLIVEREFRARVFTKAFWMATLLVPLLAIGFEVLRAEKTGETVSVSLNVADEQVATELARVLGDPSSTWLNHRYEVMHGVRDDQARSADHDAVLVAEADAVRTGRFTYRSVEPASASVRRDVEIAATYVLQKVRLENAGLDESTIASLGQAGTVNFIDDDGAEHGAPPRGLSIAAHAVSIGVMFMIIFYCTNVLRSVLDEKVNRIAEVLLSSTSAGSIVTGKVAGVSLAALLQVLLWVLIAGAALDGGWLSGNAPSDLRVAFDAMTADPVKAVVLLMFLLLGFGFYASLFASLGAVVTNEHEAQSLQFVLLAPCLMSLLALMRVTQDPDGVYATTLSILPFTSAFIMPVRLVTTEVPVAEVLASLVGLAMSTALVLWIAVRLYRRGILHTGRRATYGELVRWLTQRA